MNTFHFPIGELIITLENMFYILGLPMVGMPIPCGLYMRPKQELSVTSEFFQFVQPGDNPYDCGGISWLSLRFAGLPRGANLDLVRIHTKAYVQFVLGKILFLNPNRNVCHPRYLLFLDDVTKITEYAWGAAVLAGLYRNLNKATHISATAIGGCATLL